MSERVPEGGGLTAPSLTDFVNVREHDSGKDDPRIQPTVIDDLDFTDPFYSGGTAFDDPKPQPYTGREARGDMAAYAATSFKNAQNVKDVAGYARVQTFALNGTMPPLLIAGQDWARKRVTVRLITEERSVNVSVGDSPSEQRGSGAFDALMGPHYVLYNHNFYDNANYIELTNNEDVWVTCPTSVTAASPSVITVLIERYEK